MSIGEGWALGSVAYRNRNPGNLRSSPNAVGKDPNGYAVFASFVDGYDALLDDLRAKFTGHTESGLGPGSSLLRFFRAYAPSSDHNYPDQYAAFVAHWLTVALRFPVGLNTTLAEIWKP